MNNRFLGELVKFRVCPTNLILNCLNMCLDDFVHHNVDIACNLLGKREREREREREKKEKERERARKRKRKRKRERKKEKEKFNKHIMKIILK